MITQDRLREMFNYDEVYGLFYRLIKTNQNQTVGETVGDYIGKHDRYGKIRIDDRLYKTHRLAFLYMTGRFPDHIDHIDHDTSNNSWSNLREVDNADNMKNKSVYINSSTKVTGVSETSYGKFRAYIQHDGKQKSLGNYADIEDAIKARQEADIKYNYHENHGGA